MLIIPPGVPLHREFAPTIKWNQRPQSKLTRSRTQTQIWHRESSHFSDLCILQIMFYFSTQTIKKPKQFHYVLTYGRSTKNEGKLTK